MPAPRLIALLALFLAGCGGGGSAPQLVEATVVVTVNDQPLPFALVTLTPTDPKYGANAIASGVTDANGRATLMCGGKAGACAGANKVTVAEGPPPEEVRGESAEAQKKASEYQRNLKNRPIPEKYETLAKSDLSVEVKAGQTEYKLALKR